MKKNVSELIGFELDWAVGVALGKVWSKTKYPFQPSTVWGDGGPIIEQACIFLIPLIAPYHTTEVWNAYTIEWDSDLPCWGNIGPTPLIAAMRCFVESRLGEEVEIPEEVMK